MDKKSKVLIGKQENNVNKEYIYNKLHWLLDVINGNVCSSALEAFKVLNELESIPENPYTWAICMMREAIENFYNRAQTFSGTTM